MSLAHDAALLTASQYVAAAAGFATTLVAARWLGPAHFGVAAVVMAYPLAVSTLVSIKSGNVTLRYLPGMLEAGSWGEFLALSKVGFLVDLAASLVGFAGIAGAALLAGDLPGTDGHGGLVALYAASLPFASFGGTGLAVLSSLRRFGLASLLQVSDKIIVLVGVVLALMIAPTPNALVAGTAVGQAVAGITWLVVVSYVLAKEGGSWWSARIRRVQHLGKELRSLFGWNFVGVTLSGTISQLPVIILGSVRTPADAAYFRLASALAVVADYPELALGRVAYPMTSSALVSGRANAVRDLHQRWIRREGLLACGFVVIVMVLLPVLVPLFFGQRYDVMVLGAEYMLLGVAVSSLFFFVVPYLYASGLVKVWVTAYGCYAIAVLGGGTVLAETQGFTALAAATGIGLAILNVVLGLAILAKLPSVQARRIPR